MLSQILGFQQFKIKQPQTWMDSAKIKQGVCDNIYCFIKAAGHLMTYIDPCTDFQTHFVSRRITTQSCDESRLMYNYCWKREDTLLNVHDYIC